MPQFYSKSLISLPDPSCWPFSSKASRLTVCKQRKHAGDILTDPVQASNGCIIVCSCHHGIPASSAFCMSFGELVLRSGARHDSPLSPRFHTSRSVRRWFSLSQLGCTCCYCLSQMGRRRRSVPWFPFWVVVVVCRVVYKQPSSSPSLFPRHASLVVSAFIHCRFLMVLHSPYSSLCAALVRPCTLPPLLADKPHVPAQRYEDRAPSGRFS